MLFGIDLLMIEPGFVNTTMYDKGEKEDLSEFKPIEYWNAVHRATFQELDFTQASSCENARRRGRKATRIHKAEVERVILTLSEGAGKHYRKPSMKVHSARFS